MNKRFDLHKLTLTDFKPSEFQKATGKLSKEKKGDSEETTPKPDSVPSGRTTLHLNKIRGVVSSDQSKTEQKEKPVEQVSAPPQVEESTLRNQKQEAVSPAQEREPVSESEEIEITSVSEKEDKEIVPGNDISEKTKNPSIPNDNQTILDKASSSQTRTERSAALHTKAVRVKKQNNNTLDPDTLVPFNTRQPKWLKDAFFKACHEKGATPSLVMRNLMKSYCGLCLLLMIFTFSVTAGTQKKITYTTEQILDYFYSKTFDIKSHVPNIRSSLGMRHSLWQTGDKDSTDYVYADHSNTRLEARIEIPILDIGYLRDHSKEKVEFRAFVMKSLSRILAAQKSVAILEKRSGLIKTRLRYLKNQANLKLVNKSDMFPVEDNLFAVQSQLFEAQSTLEQRIIDLSVIAGNSWLEAYRMIIKWDGELFDRIK